MELLPLERAVIEALVSREEPGYSELRQQLESCRVTSREMTGVGFYTGLEVDPSAPPAPESVGNPLGHGHSFPDDAYADVDGLEHGAGFLLWLADGRLETLEGFSYEESWPDEVKAFAVRMAPIHRSP
jgi:hypothetical protein